MTATEAATARVAPGAPGLHEAAQSHNPADKTTTVSPPPLRTAVALQVAAALIWLPQAALIAFAIGGIADGAPASAALLPAALILALGILRAALDRTGTRLAFASARTQLSRLRDRATEAVASRSPLDASRPSSGLVASTLAEQAEAIVPYLARFRPLRMKATIVPLVLLAAIAPLSWAAALVLLMAAPVIPVFMALIGWQAKAASERQLVEMSDMNAFLLDRLRGLATIRAFDAVDRTARQLYANAERLRVSTMVVLRIAFLSSAVLELFAALGVALVAVYVGFHYLGELNFGAWGAKLTLTQGLFILLLAPAFFEPLRDLSSVWHDRAAGEAGLDALARLADGGTRLVGALEAPAPSPSATPFSVATDTLSFHYGAPSHPVLDRLDLSIRPGEHVALMAHSGGGKSTLLALLAGLAPATAGTIRLGGTPLTPATAATLRAHIAWLGQPPHIFSGTLAGNIRLGRPGIGTPQLSRALATVQLEDVAARRGSAPIGESGAGLSGGEALRLALARAAAGPRPALILADEPTAHLDRETANDVIERLLAVASGTTLIVATHDPVLAARLDRIVTLPAIEVQP